MAKLLITGATGNVGREVLRFLEVNKTSHEIIAGVRDTARATAELNTYPGLRFRAFDMEDPDTFTTALHGIDILFLLRPPHLSNVNKYFTPLIEAMVKSNIQRVVFLSVQGAEKSKLIPHHRIENLLIKAGLEYVFLRPAYFMQNLTTTLYEDIKTGRSISLPAGNTKFNWIDVCNIGEVAAIVLNDFAQFKNKSFEITGSENLSFSEVVTIMNQEIDIPITYRDVHPILFFWNKRKEGIKPGLILVIMLLHYLPRFQQEPIIYPYYKQLTGKKPTTLKEFIKVNSELFN